MNVNSKSKSLAVSVARARWWLCVSSLVLSLALAICEISVSAKPNDALFMAAVNAAMTKMTEAMSVKPSGNADDDFVATMVPHHRGAIEMAEAELQYGHNAQLRRIAQEVIVTQQQEIAAMRLAAGQQLPPSVPVPDQPSPP